VKCRVTAVTIILLG